MKSFDERYKFDTDNNLIIRREAVLDDHLQACHDLRMQTPETGKFRGGHMHRVASIPPIVALEMMKEGINLFNLDEEGKKRLFRKLNIDMPAFKTVNAKL